MSVEKSLSNNSSKKFSNKNILLALLGVIALIALIIYFQYKNRPKSTEESTYLIKEESGTNNKNTEPFSSIDIDGDGDKEQVPREIVESKILMLTENNQLYVISPIDKDKKLLIDGVSSYASSKDKNYIAYLKTYPFITDKAKSDGDIHIYNLKTQQESKIVAGKAAQRNISWSPDGRYVIVERGTSTTGSNDVYSVETGKNTGCTFSGSILWISNTEFLNPLFSNNFTPRGGQVINARGIRKVNIETCQSETLILPTNTADFSAIKLMGNDLVVLKTYVDKPEDWTDFSQGSKIKTTYEKFNLLTKLGIPYPEYENEIKIETDRLKALVPYTVKVKRIYTTNKDMATGWELINVYKGGTIYNNEVYLMGPEKTVVKIGDNATGTWL
ncbi:MAG TPA: hypothetical protein P5014_01825 [Patescibacteria group bacterium]|nr:hypothetical protein [bacterium]HRY56882.1 hypothetical protein [Patescibacteria group bacterium]